MLKLRQNTLQNSDAFTFPPNTDFISHHSLKIFHFNENISLDRILSCPELFTPNNWILCLTSLNHALLILNASTNFIIYTSVGKDFKLALKQILSR